MNPFSTLNLRSSSSLLLLILIVVLAGCPDSDYNSEVAMGTNRIPIDKVLLGRWLPADTKTDKLPDSLGQVYVQITQTKNSSFAFTYGATKVDLTSISQIDPRELKSTVFITNVGGTRIMNRRKETKEGKVLYSFSRYEADGRFLRLWNVQDSLFTDKDNTLRKFTDPKALRTYAAARVNRKGFFNDDFKLYVRPDVPSKEVFAMGWDAFKAKDYKNARLWFEAAANLGNVNAQRWMGYLYLEKKDTVKAVAYFTQAMHQGDLLAQVKVGDQLYKGYWDNKNGIKSFRRDYRQAIDLWMKASEQGSEHANENLFKAFMSGDGIGRDLYRAQTYAKKWAATKPDNSYRRKIVKWIDYEIRKHAGQISNSEPQCNDFNSFSDVITESKLADKSLNKRIRYPKAALTAGIEGKVYIAILINPAGHVVDANVTRGVTTSIDNEAIRVVRQAFFTPSKLYGVPVCTKKPMYFTFKIPSKTSSEPGTADQITDTRRQAIAKLTVRTRTSLMDASTRVLILQNPGRSTVRFLLECSRPQGLTKYWNVTIHPFKSLELGFLQGWPGNFKFGDKCTAYDGDTKIWSVKPLSNKERRINL